MASRLNRAIELLEQDQAIYYVGGHTGHGLLLVAGQAAWVLALVGLGRVVQARAVRRLVVQGG